MRKPVRMNRQPPVRTSESCLNAFTTAGRSSFFASLAREENAGRTAGRFSLGCRILIATSRPLRRSMPRKIEAVLLHGEEFHI